MATRPARDNFDFVRLAAATSVIVSHLSWLHNGKPGAVSDFGRVGVCAFFAVSGFLVAQSWERDSCLGRFLARRALRILPGLAVLIALSVLVLGPVVTTLPLSAYFGSSMTADYCRNVLLFPISFGLPGVFQTNPYPYVVNGPLWTLPMEALMYAVLALLGLLGAMTRRGVLIFLALALGLTAYDWEFWADGAAPPFTVLTMIAPELIYFGFCFASGMALALWRHRIRFVGWSWIGVLVLGAWFRFTPVEPWVMLLGIPYAVIAFALQPLPVLRRFGRFGDFSYGAYIYAFPIQQAVMHFRPGISMAAFAALAIVLPTAAGVLSWHGVEKRALRLKHLLRRAEPLIASPEAATPPLPAFLAGHVGR